MLSGSCMPPLDLDPKFSAVGRGFRSLWAMCDLADSLIGKANQIEASCHNSFFFEFKKQKSQHSLAIRIARAAGSKTVSSLFPPSKNALRCSGLGLTSHGSLLDGGGGFAYEHTNITAQRAVKIYYATLNDASESDLIERSLAFGLDL